MGPELPHAMSAHTPLLLPGIPSMQLREDGTSPRFVVRPWDGGPEWSAVAALEEDGGVAPSVRLFLDAQLESHDVVLDLTPGAGFIALSAATSPQRPHVIALVTSQAAQDALIEAALEADAHVEALQGSDLSPAQLVSRLIERMLPESRLFVHSDLSALGGWLPALQELAAEGLLVAWCTSGHGDASTVRGAQASLRAQGFAPHVLAECAGELQLVPAEDEDSECIAILADIAIDSAATAPSDTEAAVLPPVAEAPAPVVTVAAAPVVASSVAAAPAAAVGVRTRALNLIAPYCRTGYGVVGANMVQALSVERVPLAFFPMGGADPSMPPSQAFRDAIARQDRFEPDAPSVRIAQQFDLALHVGRGPRIGFPIFEATRFTPREKHHLQAQDRLLVCSAWARDVLLENGVYKIPVDVVPLGVDRSLFHERLDAGPARRETVFVQVGKLELRKNQLGVLRAFEAAFEPSSPVRLVLACHNPFMSADAFERALAPFRTSRLARRITVLGKPLPQHTDVAALMASADCGVFASLAEGWNLEALEMLSVGRHVIATDYSAHTEFLTAANSRLVTIDALAPAPGGPEGAAWAHWGEAQHEQLVSHLRAVHTARVEGTLTRNDAGIATATHFSWQHSARTLLAAIGRA